MGVAFGWVGRMGTVVMEMALPGLGGHWLDARWGTQYWVLIGFGIGFVAGLIHLMSMLKSFNAKQNPQQKTPEDSSSE